MLDEINKIFKIYIVLRVIASFLSAWLEWRGFF